MSVKDLTKQIQELAETFKSKRTAMLQALHLVRWHYGYLHPDGIKLVSDILGIDEGTIRDVASFYDFFKFKPTGKYHFRICTNIPCIIRGSETLLETLKSTLSIDQGEVTPDGKISYEECECIGCGDNPPPILINDTRYDGITKEKLIRLIEKAKKDEL